MSSALSCRCSGALHGRAELQSLLERLAERIGRALERRGVLVRDVESSFLELDPAGGGSIDDLLGHSITYRVALGARAGQKVTPAGRGSKAPSGEAERATPKHVALNWAHRLKRYSGSRSSSARAAADGAARCKARAPHFPKTGGSYGAQRRAREDERRHARVLSASRSRSDFRHCSQPDFHDRRFQSLCARPNGRSWIRATAAAPMSTE
jgi:hypothetical protein